jgi:hypothetical protein
MKRERSDIKFIMWRKRVDMTLLLSGQTPIPTWLVKQWRLKEVFDFSSNSHPVLIKWGKYQYDGFIKIVHYDNRELVRLEIKDSAQKWLINAFMHTYETLVLKAQEVETYEFLDIEFDPLSKQFILTVYYKQS